MQRTAPVAINNMRVGAGCTQRAYRFDVLAVQVAAGISKGRRFQADSHSHSPLSGMLKRRKHAPRAHDVRGQSHRPRVLRRRQNRTG